MKGARSDLLRMAQWLQEQQCNVYICTACPRQDVSALNEVIHQICSQTGTEEIDCYRSFVYGDGNIVRHFFVPDGIHLSRFDSKTLVGSINKRIHVIKRQSNDGHQSTSGNQRVQPGNRRPNAEDRIPHQNASGGQQIQIRSRPRNIDGQILHQSASRSQQFQTGSRPRRPTRRAADCDSDRDDVTVNQSTNNTNTPVNGGFYYIDNGRTVFLSGPNQKIQDIFTKQKQTTGISSTNVAPVDTLYDDTPGYMNIRKSPMPEDPVQGPRSVSNLTISEI
ncbi:hypothetical protein ACF0H5_009422 [Mactra antiquata]